MLTLTCLRLPLIQTLSCGGKWSIEWQQKDLCICDTSVPPERVFSTAGYVCNDSRSRLLPKNVNKLVHHYYTYMYVLLYSQQFDTIIVVIMIFLVDNIEFEMMSFSFLTTTLDDISTRCSSPPQGANSSFHVHRSN